MELTLSQQRRRTSVSTLTDPKILGPAVLDAFRKLDPRVMVTQPRDVHGRGGRDA